jgi:hypothetical protein
MNEYTLLLLDLIMLRVEEKDDLLYNKLYEAFTCIFKEPIMKKKPIEIKYSISVLVEYFAHKEEYEKCLALHQLGFEMYNSIS